jgi:hypothetical protein
MIEMDKSVFQGAKVSQVLRLEKLTPINFLTFESFLEESVEKSG